MTTGQIIFRDIGVKTTDGRKLMSFIGIVAVPEDTPFKGEHQYTVVGDDEAIAVKATLGSLDVRERTMHQSLGNLVLLPIWRH